MVETKIDHNIQGNNLKSFRLVKYFAAIGLAVIFLAVVLITMLDNHWLRSMQRRQNSNYAKVIIENFNHQFIVQFYNPVGTALGHVRTSDPDVLQVLDNVSKNTLHSFKVTQINIYTLDNRVYYSWDKSFIHKQAMASSAFLNGLEGKTTEYLVEEGSALGMFFGKPPKVTLITTGPLRYERQFSESTDEVLSVIEVHLDVSDEYKEIYMIEFLVSFTSIGLILGFFVVLIFVVYRGEIRMQRRANRELALRERLNRAERFAAIGELTSSISHEIRNPLGIIRSTAAMLKKRMVKTDPGNMLPDIIVEESNRLNDILTDFINFARPREANMHITTIEEVINKNISFLEPRLLETGAKIDVEYGPNLPPIYADEAMLYQALLNIFMNGLQAKEEDAIIHVTVSSGSDNIMIFIDDNGPGVAQDVLDRVWDPFFTTKEKGTGLGLGIVKNIIEAHNGEIHIYNLEGQGARVEIILPAAQGS